MYMYLIWSKLGQLVSTPLLKLLSLLSLHVSLWMLQAKLLTCNFSCAYIGLLLYASFGDTVPLCARCDRCVTMTNLKPLKIVVFSFCSMFVTI